MKIAVLLTGNELMTGDTVDSNSSMMAQKLTEAGLDIGHKVTVGDDLELLIATLDALSKRYPAVIINGGLGPTVDDLTAEALSRLTGSPLVENPEAKVHLERWAAQWGVVLNRANLKQAQLPASGSVIPNRLGSAVGIAMEHNGALLLSTPGVPSELRDMLDSHLVEQLNQRFPAAQARKVRRLRVFGIGESSLQEKLSQHSEVWPASVELGFRASLPLLELKLQSSAADVADVARCEGLVRQLIGDKIIGENDVTLAAVIIDLLKHQNKTVTVAESCTGGLIASGLTAEPGASVVFEAGWVTYSNRVKHDLLGVEEAIIEQRGAVSEEVVLAMARGALLASGADYALAVSGIAGPSGGSEEKPVGTVWIACGSKNNLFARKFQFFRSRQIFQTIVANIALDLLRRELIGLNTHPGYFSR